MARQKKNRKLAASQRKLKNARQRHKYRLEKKGYNKKTIDTLLDGFRDEFVDASGHVNVGNLTSAEIDRRISEHVKSRFKITGEDLVNLLRNNYKNFIDTQDSNGPLITVFRDDIFSDGWDRQIDIDKLGEFYKLIGQELTDKVGDSITMFINSKFS